MKKDQNLIVTDSRKLDEVVNTLEYLQATIKNDLEPISKQLGKADQVRLSLNELTSTMNKFNDDLAKKVKLGSAQEIIVILNEIENKTERLGKSLTDRYEFVSQRHQNELLKLLSDFRSTLNQFEEVLHSLMTKKVNELDIRKIEEKIEEYVKGKLNHFPFDRIKSLHKVSDMQKVLEKQMHVYDSYICQIKDQNIRMEKIFEWNSEHIATIQIKYILTAFGLGIVLGYTNFFQVLS